MSRKNKCQPSEKTKTVTGKLIQHKYRLKLFHRVLVMIDANDVQQLNDHVI